MWARVILSLCRWISMFFFLLIYCDAHSAHNMYRNTQAFRWARSQHSLLCQLLCFNSFSFPLIFRFLPFSPILLHIVHHMFFLFWWQYYAWDSHYNPFPLNPLLSSMLDFFCLNHIIVIIIAIIIINSYRWKLSFADCSQSQELWKLYFFSRWKDNQMIWAACIDCELQNLLWMIFNS